MNKRQQAKNDKANLQFSLVKDEIKKHELGLIALKQADIIGSWIVLDVNLHTVQLACFGGRDKGYTTSIQLAWIDPQGNKTHIGQLALV
jgi:hypothetical protein